MDSGITLSALHVFVALLVLNAVRWLLLRSKSGFVHQHKTRLALEIAALRKQAEQFNTPSTYVKCAKFQRLANAKEKELAALQAHKDVSLQDRINAVVSTTKVGSCEAPLKILLLCWFRLTHGTIGESRVLAAYARCYQGAEAACLCTRQQPGHNPITSASGYCC
eukprot:GHUV01026070.1.p1 GENE.GHUV01026070.1~~GHUV01026070.1.p1  ORF type:complete len:165 (+),score=21.56 GHUV01026070.1:150-644(+)